MDESLYVTALKATPAPPAVSMSHPATLWVEG